MSHLHDEAVRLSMERPYTMGCSRKSLLPFRMRREHTAPEIKVSSKFFHPDEQVVRQLTHQHILDIGDRLLKNMQLNSERRAQQAYQRLVEKERVRFEKDYIKKSDDIAKQWQTKLEEERVQLQKDLETTLINMERSHLEKSHHEEQLLVRRMKDECDQALERQRKHANEQLSLAVKQVEAQLCEFLEVKHMEEKERLTRELTEQKESEYKQREIKIVEKIKNVLSNEYDENIKILNKQHAQEIADLKHKLKQAEENFRQEYSLRVRLESDFRLLQTDYKRFMDNSNAFHSDYMLKLHHIGEQIGDEKFEQILDRILAEMNVQYRPVQSGKSQTKRPKSCLKLREK